MTGRSPEFHGMSASRTYGKWSSMVSRCTNPNDPRWEDYGGRGITVCLRWRHSFLYFLADMGEAPEGLTLDRFPNNDGNYEPGNCRWATPSEQVANRRPSRLRKDNAWGITGVSWDAPRQQFKAEIKAQGKRSQLGRSPDFFEACCLRKSAEQRFSTNP